MRSFARQQNPRKQGDIGLGVAIAWFTSSGWTVCVPLTDSQDYDLVVDDGSGVKRVQVKTCTRRKPSGGFEVGLQVRGGNRSWTGQSKNFSAEASDLLFVALADGRMFLLPSHLADGRTVIVVGGRSYGEYEIK